MNVNRTRRIVFYVGSFDRFRDYISDQLASLLDAKTGEPVMRVERKNGGRTVVFVPGRRFEYLGTGHGDITRNMRGLSASAVDLVIDIEHRLRDIRRPELAEHARLVTRGATEAERAREAMIDEVMRESGEPYEIVVEAVDALAACNDYPPEATS